MQDRYAGDVGDFSKFALMRQLEAKSDKPLGLIWFKHPDETHNQDGRHTQYTSDSRWRQCDAGLCELLGDLVRSGKRTIADLEALPLFALPAQYHSHYCHPHESRIWSRKDWFASAMETVKDCQVVFVDPDNGVRLQERAKPSPKHIEFAEAFSLAKAHPVTVIYHHFDRSQSHFGQMALLKSTFQNTLPNHEIEVLRYRRISPRAYVCLIHRDFHESFNGSLHHLTSGHWAFHFERH